MKTWNDVFPSVAGVSQAFAYTRRGYNFSLPDLANRDGATVVEELRELLKAQGIRPPYILVGHSLGGLYVELFAKLHPDEVVGLVLVDPTHPDHLARIKQERPHDYAIIQTVKVLSSADTLGAELRAAEKTGAECKAAGSMPRCPIILLTAAKPHTGSGSSTTDFTAALQKERLTEWPTARQILVPCNHYIQKEKPEVVIAAIRELIEKARRNSAHK